MTQTDRGLLDYLLGFLSERRRELYDSVLQNRTRHLTVLVEELFQPHNTNAVLRSCECFGIQNVHVIENVNAFDISTGVSMGSHKWLDIYTYSQTSDAIQTLKHQGYTVVATTLNEQSISPYEYDFRKPTAFMFGTEKTGLSEEAIREADVCMKIPMHGFTESFNISVSAAILLHYFSRAIREEEGLNWQLNEDEIAALKMKWLEEHLQAFDQMKKRYYETIHQNE